MGLDRQRRRTRLARTVTLTIALVFACTGVAEAEQAGDLDVTFDGDGRAETTASYTGAQAIGVESDGDILVATGRTTSQFDPGTGFILHIPRDGGAFSTLATLPNALFVDVLVQPDGKIVAAGSFGGPSNSQMLVARFDPNGALDTSFAGDGTFTSTDADSAVSIARAPDGKLVVAGENVVKRLNSDGTPDQTYTPAGSNRIDAVAVQADGKPVVVGRNFTAKRWLIVRLTAAFAPDPGFNPPALDFAEFVAQDLAEARDVTVQPDGRILVAGQSRPDNGPGPVVRLLEDGTLDPSFDQDGIVLIPKGISTAIPGTTVFSVVLDAQGRILAGGQRDLGYMVSRLNPDGSIDPTFRTTLPLNSVSDLAPLPDGKFLAAWTTAGQADPPPPPGASTSVAGVARVLGAGIDRSVPPASPGAPSATCGGEQATIVGSERSEALTGTRGRDVIAGLGGADRIKGLRGNDLVCGNAGRDRLFGGPGRDRLLGGPGKDKLVGGPGRDRLKGGKGQDKLNGGPGKDEQVQ